uniref:Uncharacterized protein n=1 Tax=Meloidogyne hapla TaxID=6305 RepID=A0A1I8BU78_MELHA
MDKIFEPDQILTKNEEYKEFEYSPHLNIEWPKRLIQFKVVDDLEGKKLKKIICLNISLLKQNKNLKLKNEQIFFFQNNGRTETFYYSVNVCPEDKYRLFYNNGDEIEEEKNEKESKSIEIDEEEKKFRKILLTEHMKNELNKRIYNSKGLPPSEEDDPNEQKIIEKMFKIDEKDKNDIKDDEINKAKKQKINESKNEQMKEGMLSIWGG